MHMLKSVGLALALGVAPWFSSNLSAPARADDDAVDKQALLASAARSVVRVAYELQYDRGEAPYGGLGPMQRYQGQAYYSDTTEVIAEERPDERAGFVLSPTMVLTEDTVMQSRFVKSITVRCGEQRIEAKLHRVCEGERAVLLELAQPLRDVTPLAFDPSAEGPLYSISYAERGGRWTLTASPFTTSLNVDEDGRAFHRAAGNALIVTAGGAPVGMAMKPDLPADGSWKGSPADWKGVPAHDLTRLIDQTEQRTNDLIVRVALSFRSPRESPGGGSGMMFGDYEDGSATERDVSGVLLEDGRVLVLATLKPKVTARLERVRLFGGGLDGATATFVGSLRDYGAFVAQLDEPNGNAVQPADSILDYRDQLLFAAEVRIQGENRVSYFNRARMAAFQIGWKEQIYPRVSGWGENAFVFDADGRLVALPISRRTKVVMEERWDYEEARVTAMMYLQNALNNLDAHIDVDNVPLSEADENRLAWLGVELQQMDRELARMNGVSAQTNDGETGALVIYVYEGSPAANAGLQMGDILLRMTVEGQPRPLEIQTESDMNGYPGGAFPWDRWGELPEEYFDQIPPPWTSAENWINRKLTDLGFGKNFTAEVFRNGEMLTEAFEIVEGPAHYASAPKHKAQDIGVTVREMTYEVRRYFQMTPDDPGVIISKLEQGSKASIAGLKPYEIVIAVDDQPIHTVDDFASAVAIEGSHLLAVKRMTEGRTVKLKTELTAEDE